MILGNLSKIKIKMVLSTSVNNTNFFTNSIGYKSLIMGILSLINVAKVNKNVTTAKPMSVNIFPLLSGDDPQVLPEMLLIKDVKTKSNRPQCVFLK